MDPLEFGGRKDRDDWEDKDDRKGKKGGKGPDGSRRGIEDRIFFTGEGDGGNFNPVGGAESGIVRLDPETGDAVRVAEIDRSVVLDASIPVWTDAVDDGADEVGTPESLGILDVSKLFGEPAGSLFLFDIQNHGIDDRERFNAESRITDNDLKEGGQLLLLRKRDPVADDLEDDDDD